MEFIFVHMKNGYRYHAMWCVFFFFFLQYDIFYSLLIISFYNFGF